MRKQYFETAMICVSLVAIGIWFNLVGYGGAFLSPANQESVFSLTRYAYYIGRIAVTAAFFFAPLFFDRAYNYLAVGMPLLMLSNTLGYALAFNQTMISPSALGISSTFIMGISYMWVDASLYVLLARRYEPQYTVIVIAVAQALEQLGGMIVSAFVPDVAQVLIAYVCAAMPLATLLTVRPLKTSKVKAEQISGSASRHFHLLLIASSVAVTALGAASSVGAWGRVRPDYSLLGAESFLVDNMLSCLIMFACTWFLLRSSHHRPISYRYQASFLVISCGLLFALCSDNLFEGSSRTVQVIMNGIEYYSHVLMWTMVCQGILELDENPYRVASLGMLPYSVFSMLWILTLDINVRLSTFVTFALACSIIIVASIHPRMLYERNLPTFSRKRDLNEYGIKGEPYIPVESNGKSVAEVVTKRAMYLSEKYSLTKRESEVLSLLAQGRAKGVICKMLVLSEGTVKTHVKHIFAKTGVSSHQDLLDIIYGTEETDG